MTMNLELTEQQAEFLHNAVCGVPDDQREDGDEAMYGDLLSKLNSLLTIYEIGRDGWR